MADNAVDSPDNPADCQYGPWWKSPWTWVIIVCCLGGGIGIGYGIGKALENNDRVDDPPLRTSSAAAAAVRQLQEDLPPPGYGEDEDIMNFLATMSVDEKIGQMLLADVQLFYDFPDPDDPNPGDPVFSRQRLLEMMQKVPFGSVFNSISAGFGNPLLRADDWQVIVRHFSSVAAELGLIWPLYGIDTVHGANYVLDSAIFPQQLSLGGSYNRTAARVMGEIGGKDTRAAGIGWTFSPILDLATVPNWSRNFETWGESPYVAGEMTKQLLNGYQGDNGTEIHLNTRIAACQKHFVAYAASANGQDRGPVGIGDATLMNIYMKPYEIAMEVNPATIMSGFHCQNDDPAAGSEKYLKNLLRDYLRFPGLMVTDYNTVAELETLHHMVPTVTAALEHMFQRTTTDVTMSAWDIEPHFEILKSSYESGALTDEHLDVAVYRMLELKKKLGWNLTREHVPGDDGSPTWDYFGDTTTVGQPEDVAAALDATRQSIVLVKNSDINGAPVLPIDTSTSTPNIVLTGPSSNSTAWQSGGWTCHWQGCTEDTGPMDPHHRTLWLYLEDRVANEDDIALDYAPGLQARWPVTENKDLLIQEAAALVSGKDYVIVGLGEAPYTERVGNIGDNTLDDEQLELFRELHVADPDVPKILVLFEGRPRVLPPDIVENAAAILVGYWPGPLAGQAAGEIIFGDVNPSSTLSFGYPNQVNEGPLTHYHKYSIASVYNYDGYMNGTAGNPGEDWCHVGCWGSPLWPFGFGLSYTTFEFEIVSPSAQTVFANSADISVEVQVRVTNTGSTAGQWPVILFVSDIYRKGASPEYKMVQAFDRVDLGPAENELVTFTLTKQAFEFHTAADPFSPPIIEDGSFVLRTGVPGLEEIWREICIGFCEDDSVA